MTDPVNTDALRGLSAWLYAESQSYKSQLAADAADEVDRLRAAIDNAPHQLDCNTEPGGIGDPSICTCWKADAL